MVDVNSHVFVRKPHVSSGEIWSICDTGKHQPLIIMLGNHLLKKNRWLESGESVPRDGMEYKTQRWHNHPVVSDIRVLTGC